MKKIIGLALAAVLLLGMVAAGTFAYFSDTETSTGNVFATGTLDLGLFNLSNTTSTGSTTATFSQSGWKPGDTKNGTLYVNNNGSIAAQSMKVNFTYVSVDTTGRPTTITGSPWNTDNDKFDKMIKATTATWNSVPVDAIAGKTLEELKTAGDITLTALAANTQQPLVITWTFDSNAANGCQGNSVTVTISVTALAR